ncbi:TetR/AcrR family transcriptional regulator [Nonomuraea gerenzanensis]|uniref:Transcriptional regulator, TetR family n=1 Tax=Nonomuraea gerenzanensis TaxID=93944 RepID=A0A1M4E976_9ACTN|nr:TetR/AcrR family transcriptional regulator [Nonomuraea gerenzanensis]UBU17671.1 TetR/AcrR family transcriptional regulator [Nonomuraea gerenzanensis]SBO95441.1 transcriptional regulator, TetR family [Nonomuraea gerenzanensis]
MSPEPNPQRRSEKSRSAIIEAALDLCGEHGYGHVTVEAIAARAKVSKKTIYRWWPSKGAVVLDALDETVNPAVTFPNTGDLRADLEAQMWGLLQGVMAEPRTGRALTGLIADTQHDPDLARSLNDDLIGPRAQEARARLAKAKAAGQLSRDADLDLALELLYGPVYYRLLLHQGDLHTREELRKVIDHALRALA